jgi:fused signal recognition particle receptor
MEEGMLEILQPCEAPLVIPDSPRPYVILMVGVNGAGKTTTIGKLARRFKADGHKVMLAAGDTFRAAAVEQLQTWGARNDEPVVAHHTGADPAAVMYDALEAAKARGIDVLIGDTAGRLHTQDNLMDELKKVKRVLTKIDPAAPHETLLVLDASLGQNALVQALRFHESIGLTGLAMTKLDGSAKGGILLAVAERLGVPIRYLGIGEAAEDLDEFRAAPFVEALLHGDEDGQRRRA